MNLKEFFTSVKEIIEDADEEKLKNMLYAVCKKVDVNHREGLFKLLENVSSIETLDSLSEIKKENERVRKSLARVLNGEYSVYSEYNQNYRDWDDSDDEFNFFDRNGVGRVVNGAIRFLKECKECGYYSIGIQTIEMLLKIELEVDGDCDDFSSYYDNPFNLRYIFGFYFSSNESEFINNSLFVAYHGLTKEKRIELILKILDMCGSDYFYTTTWIKENRKSINGPSEPQKLSL